MTTVITDSSFLGYTCDAPTMWANNFFRDLCCNRVGISANRLTQPITALGILLLHE